MFKSERAMTDCTGAEWEHLLRIRAILKLKGSDALAVAWLNERWALIVTNEDGRLRKPLVLRTIDELEAAANEL